ncbi:hypothetical protein GNP84_18270 [Aliivibrio fischeri]|nr:hypothetical protein [Aliivibrio fischeri]
MMSTLSTWKSYMRTKLLKQSALSSFIFCTSALVHNAFAEDTNKEEIPAEPTELEQDSNLKWGGSLSLGYDSNLYSASDYRSSRAISFHGSLYLAFWEHYSLYSNTGGYRTLQNAEGFYSTDTVVGLSRSSLLTFGDSGRMSISGQFSIPTSQASQDSFLNTAFRIQTPFTFKLADVGFLIAPRVRKNFHQYTTSPSGNVNISWGLSLLLGANYNYGDAFFSISALGGTSINYNGRWADGYSYGGNVSAGYNLLEDLSISLTLASSGVYTDAAQGTLGSFDLFDEAKATYSLGMTYSF